ERVRYPALAPAVARNWRRELPDASEEAIRQLVERQRATARACTVTHHVVRRAGTVVARCDLYRRGATAQVENVVTEPKWQGRGFARAVVLDAARAATARGCTLVFLIADAADWPQHLYRRCGFQDLGRTHAFTATATGQPS
ncbi:MAG TPA: GNAT family N-acetyltransferase, partial [Candidatus Dormibacteraeota bacterium]|nr:GNAT family N-acetyltransferase [Candidatus Dormibacteraeota bacterium]